MKRERKNRSGFYKGLALGAALSLGGAVLAGCVTNYVPRHAAGEAAAESESGTLEDINLDDRYGEVKDKLDDIQSMIDRYYIGDENVTEDDMVEGIYKGYVDALGEPYTTYYSKKEYDALKQSASGKYSGIGVVVSQDVKTGQITVIRPFEGSPGEEAGIKKDDILILLRQLLYCLNERFFIICAGYDIFTCHRFIQCCCSLSDSFILIINIYRCISTNNNKIGS